MKKRCLFLMLLILFLAGCRTVYTKTENPPDWNELVSAPRENRFFFQSRGTGESLESAEADAREQMNQAVLNAIGITDRKESNSQRDDFLNRLENSIRGEGTTPFSDEEKLYRNKEKKQTELFLLVSVTREDFADIKQEAARLFDITDPEITPLEKQAEILKEEGRITQAMEEYARAAETALKIRPLNGDIFYFRNLQKIKELIRKIVLTPVQLPEEAAVGETLTTKITIDTQYENLPFTILFNDINKEGLMKERTARIASNTKGELIFFYPSPLASGDYSVQIRLSEELIPKTGDLPNYCLELRGELKSEVEQKNLDHTIQFILNRKIIPTLLVCLDRDNLGKPLTTKDTENSLLTELQSKLYNVEKTNLSPFFLSTRNGEEIIRDLRFLYKEQYQLVLLVDSRITGFNQQKDLYTTSAEAEIRVIDLIQGTVSQSWTSSESVILQDRQNPTVLLFSQLGKKIAGEYETQNSP